MWQPHPDSTNACVSLRPAAHLPHLVTFLSSATDTTVHVIPSSASSVSLLHFPNLHPLHQNSKPIPRPQSRPNEYRDHRIDTSPATILRDRDLNSLRILQILFTLLRKPNIATFGASRPDNAQDLSSCYSLQRCHATIVWRNQSHKDPHGRSCHPLTTMIPVIDRNRLSMV